MKTTTNLTAAVAAHKAAKKANRAYTADALDLAFAAADAVKVLTAAELVAFDRMCGEAEGECS